MTVTVRELNRATLARQMLLERHAVTPLEATERLVGLQAQLARPPFVGLWSRVRGFERDQLLGLVRDRQVVRATAMRGTLHLLSARDFVRFRATLQPVLSGGMAVLGDRAAALDVERLVQAARELCDDQPRTFEEIRAILVKAGHAGDERAMGYAVRMQLPLVQVPSPGAAWGYDARAPFAVADSWLGAPLNEDAEPQALVVRYLAAFGPASAADAGVWSGLRGLREVFETLRPELLAFRDERGRELFDLPAAPRPPGDVEAPVRFLPDFDNLVLAHEDRTRLIAPEHRARIVSRNLQVAATFLVDGVVAGTWKVERKRKAATLVLTPFAKVPKPAQRALEEEGLPLLAFLEPDALEHGVRVAA